MVYEPLRPISRQNIYIYIYISGVRVMVVFRWLYFYCISRRYPLRWGAVVSWLNYVIPAIDSWVFSDNHQVKRVIDSTLDSSFLLHIHVAFHGFRSLSCGLFFSFLLFSFFVFFPSYFLPTLPVDSLSFNFKKSCYLFFGFLFQTLQTTSCLWYLTITK